MNGVNTAAIVALGISVTINIVLVMLILWVARNIEVFPWDE